MRWSGGARQWLVRWEGYGEKDDTWEPIEHLVGCATFIREFESRREEEDKQEKARALERRQQAKEAAAAEAAARREQAAATALSGTGNGGASVEIATETVSDDVLITLRCLPPQCIKMCSSGGHRMRQNFLH